MHIFHPKPLIVRENVKDTAAEGCVKEKCSLKKEAARVRIGFCRLWVESCGGTS